MTYLAWIAVAAGVGGLVALASAARVLARPPAWSLRTNVSGKQVPAVLGAAVLLGGFVVLWAHAAGVGPRDGAAGDVVAACAFVLGILAAAGQWDDRQGDESPRGFRGHLRAGRVTGGVVKIAAGGVAGVVAAALVHGGDLVMTALTALAIPLAANLFNLLDRAPGRTGKVALVVGVPLLALGDAAWGASAAGVFGGLAALLPADLGERGMLGDMGANAVGGLVGLGLALSLGALWLGVAVGALLLLNAASEIWSFSNVIDRTPLLRWFDLLGRDRRGGR